MGESIEVRYMRKREYENFSIYLSYLLRHDPLDIHLHMNNQGWVLVKELLIQLEKESHYKGVTLEDIKYVVKTDSKQRYAMKVFDGNLYIRANQGHSIKGLNIGFEEVQPPDILYHGSGLKFFDSIMKKGLIKKSRQYVHLSASIEVAKKVGKRHGEPVIFIVDAARMYKDGIKFYCSENGVWLTDYVHTKYLKVMENV